MMDVQNLVFRLSFAALAGVSIPKYYLFPDIPLVHLLSLLVLYSLNIWILNLLDIKGCGLYYNLADRQDLADICHNRKM